MLRPALWRHPRRACLCIERGHEDLVGGLPALLSYFTASGRPELERCPACGRAKPLSGLQCARCGAEVPAPAPKGTEIFA